MNLAEVAVIQQQRDGLTAAAGPPLVPPREWFEMPEPDQPTGWTVTADGQVYGHAALWGTCHTGKPGRCVTPPPSRSEYGFYKTGLTEVDDGELIPTGRITLGTGHASLTASPAATAEHYDNTGSVVADVNIRDGEHGIWVSGALRPNVTPDRIRELRGASLSGDWRNIRGALEMLGLLAVNVPGFPVPQAMAASGEEDEVLALVAAGTFDAAVLTELPAASEPSSEEWDAAIEELTAAAGKSSSYMGKRAKVKEVMREFKAGKLKSSSGNRVTSRKQAVAIALSEANMSASAEELAEVALEAAGRYEESQHPRKPKGQKGGGQWTVKELRQGLESGELSSEDVLDIVSPGIEPGTGPLAQPRSGDVVSESSTQPGITRTESEARLRAARREVEAAQSAHQYATVQAQAEGRRAGHDPRVRDAAKRLSAARDRLAAEQALRSTLGKPGDPYPSTADESSRDYAPLEPLPKPHPEAERRVIRNRRSNEPFMAAGYDESKQELLDDGWQIRDEGDGWCLLEDPDTGNVQLVSDGADVEPDDDEDELLGSEEKKVYASGEPCEECAPVDPMSLPAARTVEVRDLAGGAIRAASFTQPQREKLADKGVAMSDGSFPIRNTSDLRNAIQALGRAKNPDAARRHIIKRARALKAVGALPATWNVTASGELDEESRPELAAAGTFDETLHPRQPAGDKRGGEFAPKGTGKMITGPGGKLMSKTEAGVLQDKAEGRYVKSHSETQPEFDINKERADIERRVKEGKLSTAEGQQLTEQAWAEHQRRKDESTGGSIATPMKVASNFPKQKVTQRLVKSVADKLHNGTEPTAIMHFDRIPEEQWDEVYAKAREQLIKDGRLRIETDRFDI